MAEDQECPNWISAQSRLQPENGNINTKDTTSFAAELMPCNQGKCMIYYPNEGSQTESKKSAKIT